MGIAKSLDEATSDSTLVSGKGVLKGIQIITDGTNNATAILYDNTAASGVKLFEGGCVGANLSELYWFGDTPISFKNGVRLDIAGTGASVIVYV